MIARARPIECRGRDGWLHVVEDPAKSQFEHFREKRLTKRKRDLAEWEKIEQSKKQQ